ncbi:hypothetical protein BDF14DRAFT_1878522 [Spinellus fusiger]|nr:hypothetical protein BDF14DRAFT_1878522 [Spinellus fusiger]
MFSLYTPTRKDYSPQSPFFQTGTAALRALWLNKTHCQDTPHQEQAKTPAELPASPAIYCEQPSCQYQGQSLLLPSLAAYEMHYEQRHRNTCSVCHKVFPTSYWLVLHLDECHDIIKRMQRDQGQSTSQERRVHLMKEHAYPSHFPFDIVQTGTLSFEERQTHLYELILEKKEETEEKDEEEEEVIETLTAQLACMRIPKRISFGYNAQVSVLRKDE